MPLRRPNWVLQRKDTDSTCGDLQQPEPNLAIRLDPKNKTQVESTNDPEVQKPVEELKPSHGEAQHGVDVAEAITASWRRKYLIAAYILSVDMPQSLAAKFLLTSTAASGVSTAPTPSNRASPTTSPPT